MDRKAFTELAAYSARRALPRAERYRLVPVEEIRFRALLNCSYDVGADDPLFSLFPDEVGVERDGLNLDEFVTLIWREGRVPVWVDLTPEPERTDGLWLEAKCAGRYAEAEPQLYKHKRSSLVFNYAALWHDPAHRQR